ncbi:hypothetical protein Mapa_012598 [Marchantia paleacea]|nr:hypothetical protein Mapa_012598 [Marchantia paleacea]
MEFWGTEVAPGGPQVCHPGDEMYCHVSQAALGPSSSGKAERVVLRVETGGKDVVLGTLSSGKCDQMALDLIFDREFKLSHTGTSCSVYFCGYKTEKGEPEEFDSEMEEEEESDEEEVPEAVPMKANGDAKVASVPKGAAESVQAKKPIKSPIKPKLIDDEADEDEDSDEDDDEDEFSQMNSTVMDFDSDDESDEDDSEFEGDDMDDSDEDDSDELEDEDDEDSDDEGDSDEEEQTPELGKKRPLKGVEAKSPSGGKKARVDTPARPGLAVSPGKKLEKSATKAAIVTPSKATPVAGSKKVKGLKDVKETKKEDKTPQKTPGKEAVVKTPKSSSKTPAKVSTTPTTDSAKKLSTAYRCESCKNFSTEAGHSQHMVAKHGTPVSGK